MSFGFSGIRKFQIGVGPIRMAQPEPQRIISAASVGAGPAAAGPARCAVSKARRDFVCNFIFWFPLECCAKAQQRQLCAGTELVQNQYQLYKISANLYSPRQTGFVQV